MQLGCSVSVSVGFVVVVSAPLTAALLGAGSGNLLARRVCCGVRSTSNYSVGRRGLSSYSSGRSVQSVVSPLRYNINRTSRLPYTTTTTTPTTTTAMSSTSNNSNPDHEDTIEKSSADASLISAKKALRREIRALVRAIDPAELARQSESVWQQVRAMTAYREAKTVGLFLSMPRHEIQTASLVRDALVQGKVVYVPEVGANFEQAEMELIRCPGLDGEISADATTVDSGVDTNESSTPSASSSSSSSPSAPPRLFFQDDWPVNKWGIPEPPADYPRVCAGRGDLDIVLVPGLAFDRDGGRCGQGKGYYDRFLARIKSEDGPALVGVCLTAQLLEEGRSIPMTELDYRMECIVSPEEVIAVKQNS